MFSIEFAKVPIEYPFDDETVPAAVGDLFLDGDQETFLANLAIWKQQDYQNHWLKELGAIIDGCPKTALIVSYNDPRFAYYMEVWPCYRDGDNVHMQNCFLMYENAPKPFQKALPADFQVDDIRLYLTERAVVASEANKVSEWTISLRDIESFLNKTL